MTLRTEATTPAHELPPLVPSGGSRGGLLDVFRRHYLLRLLVRRELRSRYFGSVIGLAWSYIKPLVRFSMYFVVIGGILGLRQSVEDFAIMIFSAMIMVHVFTETLSAGTNSIVKNKSLVRKVNLPREMFPVASLLVSLYHVVPQLVILFIGAILSGWHPDLAGVAAGVLALVIIVIYCAGVGLLLSAANVFFRDVKNFVDTFSIFIRWTTPMIYPFSRVADALSGHLHWLLNVYLANPLPVVATLAQRCWWTQSAQHPAVAARTELPDHLFVRGFIALGMVCVLLVIAQVVFARLEGKFAERL